LSEKFDDIKGATVSELSQTSSTIGIVNTTGRGPIIANLHVTRERTRIFGPFFADDNNKW